MEKSWAIVLLVLAGFCLLAGVALTPLILLAVQLNSLFRPRLVLRQGHLESLGLRQYLTRRYGSKGLKRLLGEIFLNLMISSITKGIIRMGGLDLAMPLTRVFLFHDAGSSQTVDARKYKSLPRCLLTDLEKEDREINFQGAFILQGSTILAAYNDDRGWLHHPEDIRKASVFAGSKVVFALAVLGTALWLAAPDLIVAWHYGRMLDFSRTCFVIPALLFWIGLGRLTEERLNHSLRPLLNSLGSFAGREAEAGVALSRAPDWAGLVLIGLALGLAWLWQN